MGGARPCQGRGRGFESRLALFLYTKGILKGYLLYINESCRTRTVRIFVPLRSVLTEVQWTSSTPSRAMKDSAGLERFEVSALLRSVQNRHPPDVVHRLALNQKEVRIDIYARVLPDSNGSYLRSTSVGAGLCFFSFIIDEGVAGVVFLRNKSPYWPLAWLVLNSETHV